MAADKNQQQINNPLLGQPQGAPNPSGQWGTPEQPFWRPGANPTVDNIILCAGQVLLIQRSLDNDACPGQWALPGGFHDTQAPMGEPWSPGLESAQQAALRELAEETGLSLYEMEDRMEYVGFFQERSRDARNSQMAWSVSNVFLLRVPEQWMDRIQAGDDARDARWFSVEEIGSMALAFDHRDMLKRAGVI